jgi:hypothetical protein
MSDDSELPPEFVCSSEVPAEEFKEEEFDQIANEVIS